MKKNVESLMINHRNFLKLISLTVILLFIVPAMANAQGGKTNFAGTWAMNAEKSNLGTPGGGGPGGPGGGGPGGGGGGGGFRGGGNFVATQDAATLSVERTRNRNGEETKTTTKYTLDGKETVNTTGMGESKSTAKWSADGKTLTIVTSRSFNGNDMTSTEVWSLTDANTLSIASTRPGMDGTEMKTTMVYDKK